MKIRRWLLSTVLICLAVPMAVAQKVPAQFVLETSGKEIGKAQYQFLPRKTGFAVKSSYSFALGSIHADCTRQGELGPKYELRSDVLTVNSAGASQSSSFTVYPKLSRVMFETSTSGQVVQHLFPFYARTAVLNDYDPSGVQGLLYLAATQPASPQDYWVLVAKGRGTQNSAQLVAAAAGEGELHGVTVALKHWQLTVGTIVIDIWASEQNLLMEAAVPSQSLTYKREGFSLK